MPLIPTPSANSAVMIGSPIATTEPKVISRTTIAASSADHLRGVFFFFAADFLDRLSRRPRPGARRRRRPGRCPMISLTSSSFSLSVVTSNWSGRVGDLAVVADRAGAALFVGAGDFADVRAALRPWRRRLPSSASPPATRPRLRPCRRSAPCRPTAPGTGFRAGRSASLESERGQAEFFGEVRADRAGEHPDPDQGDDPADDHRLAVTGGPGGKASHWRAHRSNALQRSVCTSLTSRPAD